MTTPPPGSREAAQALEKLATDLSDIILLCDYSYDVSRKQTTYAREALSLLPTLRAALAPPADVAGEVEAIRARHEAALARMADNNWPMSEGRQDVAALLAIVDKMRADQ